MNRIYRIVWNSAINAWVVASEFATRQRGSASVSSTRRLGGVPYYLLVTLTGGAIAMIAPFVEASQNTRNEIPLCTSSDDCKYIVISHDVNNPKPAKSDNTKGWYFVNNRTDGQGTSEDRLKLLNYGVAIGDDAYAKDASVAIGSHSIAALLGVSIGGASEARGQTSVAIGSAALATGTDSLAMGRMSYSTGESSIALGMVSTATGGRSMAFGNSSKASGTRSIAIGNPNASAVDKGTPTNQVTKGNTQSSGEDAVAIGTGAVASADRATALGDLTSATATQATALGENAKASNVNATALGSNANSSGENAIASGVNSKASGNYTIAMGNVAEASDVNAVAIGSGSKATAVDSVAMGAGAEASKKNTAAVGTMSKASGESSVAFGDRATATNDFATALGDLAAASGKGSSAVGYKSQAAGLHGTALGYKTDASGEYSFAAADNAIANGPEAIAIGATAKSSAQESIALGSAAAASGVKSLAFGSDSRSEADTAVSIGSEAYASGESGVALGNKARSKAKNTVAVGYNANSVDENGIAIGQDSTTNGQNSTAIGTKTSAGVSAFAGGDHAVSSVKAVAVGNEAQALGERSVALGTNAVSTSDDSLALGANSVAGRDGLNGANESYSGTAVSSKMGAVSVGDAGKERQISNVAGATQDTDAVNLRQLKFVAKNSASSLGGGAGYDDNGNYTAPTYTTTNADGSKTSSNNVGDAITNVDNHAVSNTNDINNLKSGKIGLVQQSVAGEDITVGKDTDGKQVTFADKNGSARKLTKVANGDVKSDSSDAINGSQLYAGNQTIANALGGGSKVNDDGTVAAPSYTTTNADGSKTTSNSVGDALSNMDNHANNNTNAINNISNGKTGLTQQQAAGEKITIGKDTDGTSIDIADKNGGSRTLDNLSNGKVASDSKQGINGSQLYAGNQSIANALGGGSKVNDDGTVASPSYTVHNADGSTQSVNNVGDAITNVDGRTADNTNAINNINSGKTGLTQQQAAGEDITVGKDTDGKQIVFADKDGNTRKLTKVTKGDVNSDSVDAINGSQLYAGNQSIANALGGGSKVNDDGTVAAPSYTTTNADGSKTTSNSVGDALSNMDNHANNNTNAINNISNGKTGLTQQQAAGEKITIGKDTDGTSIDIADKNGGSRTLDNLSNGKVASDSKQGINGSQLYAGNQSIANALGGGSKVNDDGTVASPSYTVHNADGSTQSVNNVGDAITNVDGRTADNTNAINNINSGKTGLTQQQAAGEDITVGKDTDGKQIVFADKDGNTRKLTKVTKGDVSSDSVDAINGSQLYAGNQSLANALGGGSAVNPDGTVSKPKYTVNGKDYDNAGDAFAATDENGIKYDRNSDGTVNKDKVTLGGGDKGTTLSNVAAGSTAENSKDGVNGGQLYAMNKQNADALGGGAKVDPNTGEVTGPTYNLHNEDGSTTNLNNVGDALTNIDGRTVNNTNSINDLKGGRIGLVQQAAAGEDITVGKDTDGKQITFADKDGNARKLTKVSKGDITSNSVDAINGSQLYAGNQSIANAFGGDSKLNSDGTVSAPSYQMHNYDQHSGQQPAVTYNNVGDALSNVDNRTVTNTDQIREIAARVNPEGQYGYSVNGRNFERVEQALRDIDSGAIKYDRDSNGNIDTSSAKLEGKDGTRLSNLKVGSTGQKSTDAINGSQLYAANAKTAESLGGGAKVDSETGEVTGPTYNLHNADGSATSIGNVGDALTNIDGRTLNNTNAINEMQSGRTGLVQQAAPGEKITVGKDTDGSEVSYADKNGNTRKLTYVTNGDVSSSSKDAINGSQLYAGNVSIANALGGGATINPDGTVSNPRYTVNGKDYSNAGDALQALGGGSGTNSNSGEASATGNNSSATGGGSKASGSESTANGNNAQATGGKSSATGANSTASGKGSTASGEGSKASGDRSSATGQGSQATGNDSTATGAGAKASGDQSTANGVDSVASGKGATAGGNGAKATGDGGTAYGQNATASGNQSSAIGQNSEASGNRSVALGEGSTTRNADGSARDNTVSVGSEGNERTISNVAPGTQRNDAATVGQMQDGFNEAGRRIDKVDRNAKAGAASAIAMTGLPQAVLPGRNLVSVAGGTYEGQSAVAVGLSTVSDNGRWVVKGQVSGNTQSSVGAALGVGYQW